MPQSRKQGVNSFRLTEGINREERKPPGCVAPAPHLGSSSLLRTVMMWRRSGALVTLARGISSAPTRPPRRRIHVLPPGWPQQDTHPHAARSIQAAKAAAAAAAGTQADEIERHDMIINKSHVGRLIGAGGSMHQRLTEQSGASIVIIDKEAPPGFHNDLRAVVLIGSSEHITHARRLIHETTRSSEGTEVRGGSKRQLVDLRSLAPSQATLALSDALEELLDRYQGDRMSSTAKPSEAFRDWRVLFGEASRGGSGASSVGGKASYGPEAAPAPPPPPPPPPAAMAVATAAPKPDQATLAAALDFFAANGIAVARRGDQRHRAQPSIRVSADALQRAAARITRARATADAVRGTILKLVLVGSVFALIALVPRLRSLWEAAGDVDRSGSGARRDAAVPVMARAREETGHSVDHSVHSSGQGRDHHHVGRDSKLPGPSSH
jgi:rRNA processing protein Krr1/Pno1